MNSDVIIVGAGIVGNATAYYLAKRGCRVIVLEGDRNIGNGGSSRNGGGVRQSGRDTRELPLMMYGTRNIWPTLSDELGVDCEYCQGGNLRLGKTPEHLAKLKKLADSATKVGLDVTMIDSKKVKEINPYLSDEVIGASWCPTDGHANPLTTTLGFYKCARNLGVRFITGEKVASLRKVKGKLKQAIAENGTVYEADTIVLAAGYESRALAATVNIDIPMQNVLVEALVTACNVSPDAGNGGSRFLWTSDETRIFRIRWSFRFGRVYEGQRYQGELQLDGACNLQRDHKICAGSAKCQNCPYLGGL